jgi:hypothetical protein
MRNNSNNSILFIKRLQRFKTTATLSGSWVPNFIDKKKEVLSFLFMIERFLPKPKPNIKRLENLTSESVLHSASPIVQVINNFKFIGTIDS